MAVKKGSFRVGHVVTCAQKKFSYYSLLPQAGTIMATVRDSRRYSNDLLQGGVENCLLHFLYMAVPLAKA